MIEQIGNAPMEVALVGAFTLIVGAFALILWDHLRGRRRGWLRVMAVVVGAPACALGATVISVGVGWAVAATLEPDQQPPARTERTTPENRERTSSSAEVRSPETTTERSASPIRPFRFLALFTGLRGIGILRTSPLGRSRKFAKKDSTGQR